MATGQDHRELNTKWFAEFKAGNFSNREKLILNNQGLVNTIVNEYLQTNTHLEYLHDDIISEGYKSLCESVNYFVKNADKLENKNITNYIITHIIGSIGNYIDDDKIIRVPGRTKRRYKKQKRKLNELTRLFNKEDNNLKIEAEYDPRTMQDCLDSIDDACKTRDERIFTKRAYQGYSDEDIAKYMEVPIETIAFMRSSIYNRFLENTGLKDHRIPND